MAMRCDANAAILDVNSVYDRIRVFRHILGSKLNTKKKYSNTSRGDASDKAAGYAQHHAASLN
eukprot:1653476-Pleurochrysis_carterae.AAC.2